MQGKQKKKRKRKRREYTAAELAEVWDGWKRGESSKAIAGALDRGATVYYLLLRYGGIRPRARCRSARALTLAEREEISRGIAAGRTIRSIARILSRPASTLSREIRRNGGYDAYRASEADERTWERARRPKRCRLARCPRLRRLVEEKLREGWAPQQIAGWLKRTYPENESYQVSHETIYRSLFIQARGAFKKGLTQYLRSKRTIRRSQHASRKGRGGGQIQDLISIRERPAAVEDRAVPGHWEGDLLAGSNNSHIATLVERHSRYVMLAKVASKETATVVTALIEHARQLPGELYQSLTWDRGLEMADHKRFTLATDIAVYFCDPKSPWQRGSNENTNTGLVRLVLAAAIPVTLLGEVNADLLRSFPRRRHRGGDGTSPGTSRGDHRSEQHPAGDRGRSRGRSHRNAPRAPGQSDRRPIEGTSAGCSSGLQSGIHRHRTRRYSVGWI